MSTGGSLISSEHAPSTGGRTPISGLTTEQGSGGGAAMTGACGSAGAAPASWGVVCLAVLIQRASDKSAAVRSKAAGHLGAVVAEALGVASADGEPCTFRRVRWPAHQDKDCITSCRTSCGHEHIWEQLLAAMLAST